jgi:hypothetical protein
MRLSAWPLVLGLAFATPALAADTDSTTVLKRPRVAAPT